MIPTELRTLTDNYFKNNSHRFDFSTVQGCGQYMESLIPHLQVNGFPAAGFLKKYGGATQYNGHAIDALLWLTPDTIGDKLQAVDVVANAEAKPPYGANNPAPSAGWSEDIPRYDDKDWMQSAKNDEPPVLNVRVVPYVNYDEGSFERLKRMLQHDYSRRPQGPDFDVAVWASRYFHNCYMGPQGVPLGEEAALRRVKVELCFALKIEMDGYYGQQV